MTITLRSSRRETPHDLACSPIVAERRARALSLEHAGAVAFSRTVDPTTGEFHDAVILAQFGEVYLDSLGE